nr:MAG TPA: hypothetical protein [Caudoviricetes sp.]
MFDEFFTSHDFILSFFYLLLVVVCCKLVFITKLVP